MLTRRLPSKRNAYLMFTQLQTCHLPISYDTLIHVYPTSQTSFTHPSFTHQMEVNTRVSMDNIRVYLWNATKNSK